MNMSTTQKAWKRFLRETLKSDPNQSRLKAADKMQKYLFTPLEFVDPRLNMALQAAGQTSSNFVFLYDAIFGSKQEREEGKKIYTGEYKNNELDWFEEH